MSNPPTTLPQPSPATATPAPSSPSEVSPAVSRWLRKLGARSKVLFTGALSRRRSVDSVVVGMLLTLLVISFDSAGWLSQIEFLLYDARARYFQFFLPKPSDELIHLDIDDVAIASIHATEKERFPWPRSILAEMMNEIALAKPKVVGLDIIFPEGQNPSFLPPPGTAPKQIGPDRFEGVFDRIEHDRLLAESFKRLGCVLVPVALPFKTRERPSDVHIALRAELNRDVNLSQSELVDRLRARGFDAPDLEESVSRAYLDAWRAEMELAIRREVGKAPVERELVKRKLLKLEQSDVVLDRTFDELYDKALSAAEMLRFSRPIPPELPGLFSSTPEHLPISQLAQAAAYSANIAYPRFRDGVVRAVPLFIKHEERMYPQMGLAMACAQLDVDLSELRFTPDAVILPAKDARGERIIPHRTYRSDNFEEIPTFIDIPWWGTDEWEYMYDHPRHRASAAHLSVVALWDMVLTQRKMAANAGAADPALISLLAVVDETAALAYAANTPAPADYEARLKLYQSALTKIKETETEEFIRSVPAADLDEQSRRFLAAYDLLPAIMREYGALAQRLRDGRDDLRKRVQGKSVFVGWTATSVAADFVPTTLHPFSPGVVVHGAIFNGIMTGELWRTFPQWVTFLATGILGLCMTAAAAFLTPARALVVAVCLMTGYALVNGLLLFDYGNVIMGAAGPLLCIAGVWQGCTLIRLIVERYQRSRIEGRFRSYVDPALVDYVVENPDQIKLEGQVREMTVCFTDLGNFTPLTVKLKEATVPLLNRIFGAMVPEIRKNNGYVNKFLGDGIMFFFGAPRGNQHHARDALRAVLDIEDAMRVINDELTSRGLSTITLRAGVNTGNMVVGDAGSEQASDYTVLGDPVNLAARMESANKQLGTTMLVSDRTVQLAGDHGVLLRPVGQICVVGRAEPVAAYEVLCRQDEATEGQRRMVELTRAMVDAFRDARLQDCLRSADDLDRQFGPSKLTKLYRDRCQHFLREPSMQDFTCTITLAEK